MALIKEDLYPRRPDRASVLRAGPSYAVGALLLARGLAGHGQEAEVALQAQMILLVVFALTGFVDGQRWWGRLLGVVAVLAYATAFVVALAWNTGSWLPVLGLALAIAASGPTLLRGDRWLDRSMLAARSGIGLALVLVAAFVAFVLAYGPFGQHAAFGAWALLAFAALGTLDLFRILTPPPPGAGPGWWKWGAS